MSLPACGECARGSIPVEIEPWGLVHADEGAPMPMPCPDSVAGPSRSVPKPAKPEKAPKRIRRSAPVARKARPRKQRKTGRAALARLADKLCGQIVRAKGQCEGCTVYAKSEGAVMQWAHGFSRRYHAVRWNLLNSFCLCSKCHYRWTLRPLEFDQWLREQWGQPTYDELRRIALKNERVDLVATVESLRAELARTEA